MQRSMSHTQMKMCSFGSRRMFCMPQELNGDNKQSVRKIFTEIFVTLSSSFLWLELWP